MCEESKKWLKDKGLTIRHGWQAELDQGDVQAREQAEVAAAKKAAKKGGGGGEKAAAAKKGGGGGESAEQSVAMPLENNRNRPLENRLVVPQRQ